MGAKVTVESTEFIGDPAEAFPIWLESQTLKSITTPGYIPAAHTSALQIIGDKLAEDRTIASGKLSKALRAVTADPTITRAQVTESVFNGNAGYALQILWPLASLFAGKMPNRVASTTARGYLGWLDRINRVVIKGLGQEQADAVSVVLDAVGDAYLQSAGSGSAGGTEIVRGAEDVTSRVNTNEPGIYVFTTPTYLAYPPFGWNTEDVARQDFRYLKTGSTSLDVTGRIQSEIRRQTGLPEPYLIVAKFQSYQAGVDYAAMERLIHRVIGEARHGPEEDGTRRSSSRGAGTEWFVTRLPFVIAIAESLDLHLTMSQDLKSEINAVLEECELPDWILA